MSRFTWSVALTIAHEELGHGMKGYRETAVRADGLQAASTRALELVQRMKDEGEQRPIEIIGIWQSEALEFIAWVNR